MKSQIFRIFFAAILLGAGFVIAQDVDFDVQVGPAPHPMHGMLPLPPMGDDSFLFIHSEFEFGKQVKGAPYSAQAVTERVQDLADGNRITQRSTANVYRDSEGRTRREQDLALIGPWSASSGEFPHTVFIHDPATNVDYILDDKEKTARKVKMIVDFKEGAAGEAKNQKRDEIFTAPAPPPDGMKERHVYRFYNEMENAKKQSLGKQTIEGIAVEGTRITSTIPAGKIGNEHPIQIVSEKWYSPELQVVVMAHHKDPRFGETTYQLTNISRSEPDASLFKVPAGYKVTDAPGPGKIMIRKELKDKKD